jgi:hypothetical protein
VAGGGGGDAARCCCARWRRLAAAAAAAARSRAAWPGVAVGGPAEVGRHQAMSQPIDDGCGDESDGTSYRDLLDELEAADDADDGAMAAVDTTSNTSSHHVEPPPAGTSQAAAVDSGCKRDFPAGGGGRANSKRARTRELPAWMSRPVMTDTRAGSVNTTAAGAAWGGAEGQGRGGHGRRGGSGAAGQMMQRAFEREQKVQRAKLAQEKETAVEGGASADTTAQPAGGPPLLLAGADLAPAATTRGHVGDSDDDDDDGGGGGGGGGGGDDGDDDGDGGSHRAPDGGGRGVAVARPLLTRSMLPRRLVVFDIESTGFASDDVIIEVGSAAIVCRMICRYPYP